MKKIIRSVLAACLCAAAFAHVAHAAYPERPITLVVPYAPGGSADALARVLAVRVGVKLGTSVIVDNRPGASGTIGASFAAKATPDGYTVLYDATPYSINPHLFPRMPFASNALQPLALVALAPNIVIVRAESPVKSIKELVDKARAEPGKMNFASGGGGTVQRLAAELLRQRLGLDMVHVGYKSGGPAIVDVMGGQVDFMFSTIAASYPLVSSGKLRALAVSSPQRSSRLPEVPTLAETVVPGYEAYEWNGLLLPAGTPAPIADKLHKAVIEVLKEDDVKRRFVDVGVQPVGSTPDEFAEFLKKEDAKWADVIRKGNIKLD
ncbi:MULTISPECIES: Bug family tripartite tricarboxylate transporter substrate binding protein [Variovorax]|jgi:tripartite-type tricarboxylate transporter receptor subunit TctC|uniref:Bug family tripartite tricarboxylate transporter substrate binding protein n=1 Tax=Variovorax TaxID=34072 RepID=UPI0008690265|nr:MULTISPECIES: tripartite tricarboxylate transporter substrate binding protein [Variovorax]MBN8754628.1 tripartite tricarboxylate transporter substrate binding protein [Variovorax sp.]ODU19349.1 MAG: LacI family transcriptional regulator [Variovorax sp. SCN 67-85]ODV25250.1 MAG: LacI family transcriptional regulator [Variovorax sp. SCN 67-20]OJZ03069.1 MAG: LacI family transcriptional regulator [Variovorax sp. 67-131]UKI08150.1 tripartite tricarboxylate transporter substrate binding protein 